MGKYPCLHETSVNEANQGQEVTAKAFRCARPGQADSRVPILMKPLHYFSVSHCQNWHLELHECLGSVASDITVGQNLVAVNLEILLITQGSFQFLPTHSLSLSKPLCCTSGRGTKSAAILIAGL